MQMWNNAKTNPDVLEERQDGSSIELDIFVSSDLFQFQGHFPGHPIMPGVGQLDWAVCYAIDLFDLSQDVVEVSQLKYRELMGPDIKVTLKLDYQADKKRVMFSYFTEDQKFSSGILKLGSL